MNRKAKIFSSLSSHPSVNPNVHLQQAFVVDHLARLEGQKYRLMVKRAAAEGQTASSQDYLSNADQLRPGCLLLS